MMVWSARIGVVSNPIARRRCLSPGEVRGAAPRPPPMACLGGRLRRVRRAASRAGAWTSILYRQAPRRPELTAWAPPRLLQRRRSRYLVARRSAVACSSRQFFGLADLLQAQRPCASRAETLVLVHPSMPRDRGARRDEVRSCPIFAPALPPQRTFLTPFRQLRPPPPGADARAARDRLPASASGAGFCARLQVDAGAAYSGAQLSRAGQAVGAGDRLGRRGHSPLDCAARPTRVMGEVRAGDRLGSPRRLQCTVDRVGNGLP